MLSTSSSMETIDCSVLGRRGAMRRKRKRIVVMVDLGSIVEV